MIYIVLEHYDVGSDLSKVESFDALAEFLRRHKEEEGNYDKIEHIIFGEEIPWEVLKQYSPLMGL